MRASNVANGNSLEEGTPPHALCFAELDEKASKRMLFFGTNAPAFDVAQGSRGRVSAVYPVDRRPSRALTMERLTDLASGRQPDRLSWQRLSGTESDCFVGGPLLDVAFYRAAIRWKAPATQR